MDSEKDNEDLLAPMGAKRTRNHDQKRKISGNAEILVSNEVLLLREGDFKMDPDTETLSDDPLNLLNKLEIKMKTTESGALFTGEYEPSEFTNSDSAKAQVVIPVTDPPSNSANCRSRKRKNANHSMEPKQCVGTSSQTHSTDIDDTPQHKKIATTRQAPAHLVANILDAWHLLFDEAILANILKHTNDEIRKYKSKTLDNNKCILDLAELSAWIGLKYLCGIFGKNGATLEELWTPELGSGIFRASMSLKRFEFINECLRLSEQVKTKRKHNFDAMLREVTEVWEPFIANCRACYEPGVNCTIHEHMLDISATDYTKTLAIEADAEKPTNGIRIIGLHDANTHYLCNALIGKSTVAAEANVLALVGYIKKSKRTVILSERYTSMELAQNLLQYQLSLLGSLDPESLDLPVKFCSAKSGKTMQKVKAGATFTFIPADSGSQVLLACGVAEQINAKELYAAAAQSGQQFQQNAAAFSTNGAGVDSNTTNTTITTSPWTLCFFHAMLDFGCINAWLLFRHSQCGDSAVQQRDFQRQLGLFLTQQHLKRLIQKNSKTTLQRKLLISDILGESEDNLLNEAVSAAAQANTTGDNSLEKHTKLASHVQLLPKRTEKRCRCRICTWRNNHLTAWQCQQCARAMCQSHLIVRCVKCMGIKIQRNEEEEEQDVYFK